LCELVHVFRYGGHDWGWDKKWADNLEWRWDFDAGLVVDGVESGGDEWWIGRNVWFDEIGRRGVDVEWYEYVFGGDDGE
jgi:hypothetical protein